MNVYCCVDNTYYSDAHKVVSGGLHVPAYTIQRDFTILIKAFLLKAMALHPVIILDVYLHQNAYE